MSSFLIDIQRAYATSLFSRFMPKARLLKQVARDTLTAENLASAELTLRLVDAQEMQQLNHRYRGKNYATNVLSFPAEVPACVDLDLPFLGDIVLCVPVIFEEAAAQAIPFEAHWMHLIVHGILHLLGYDHDNEHEAMVMEAKEIMILEKLGVANPYEETSR